MRLTLERRDGAFDGGEEVPGIDRLLQAVPDELLLHRIRELGEDEVDRDRVSPEDAAERRFAVG